MPLDPNINTREFLKFVLNSMGDHAVRTVPELANPLPVSNEDIVSTEATNYTVSAVLSGTEYSQLLPDETKKIVLRARKNSVLQIYWATGSSDYLTVPLGGYYSADALKLIGKTIYFQSSVANNPIEIEVWT